MTEEMERAHAQQQAASLQPTAAAREIKALINDSALKVRLGCEQVDAAVKIMDEATRSNVALV